MNSTKAPVNDLNSGSSSSGSGSDFKIGTETDKPNRGRPKDLVKEDLTKK